MAPDAGEMSLAEHLGELRTRLIRVILAVVLGAVVGWVVFDPVLEFLTRPYCQVPAEFRALDESCGLIATRVLEEFSVRIKIALVVGFFLATPVVFYQLWRFVTPGLTKKERRYTLPFVVGSVVMFTAGGTFAFYVIPRGLRILLGIGGGQVVSLLSAGEYFSFMMTTVIAFGVIFEVPLLLVFLALLGIVNSQQLRRFRAHAIVANFVIAAIITPTTDPVTLLFLAGPMVVLYEGSILAARFIERSRRRREAA